VRNALRWVWDNLINGKAAGWEAGCTVILCIFTFLLYRVSNRATETSRATERAFLNFSALGSGVKLVAPDSKTWIGQEFLLNWLNTGNTPAKGIVIQDHVEALHSDLPIGYPFPETKTPSLAVIGPKGSYATLARVTNIDLLDAWQAKSRIFFWGSVVYRDTFPGDPDRLSEFCVEMTHVAFGTSLPGNQNPATPKSIALSTPVAPSTPDTLAGFQWQACREHNCYDEDCKDYSAKIKEMRAE
jgi:hypothetical protein